jgi:hypothetical protein
MHSLEQCYGYALGPNPDYSIYDQILGRYGLLKQNRGIELRLLTSEGFPAVLYLSATDVRDIDALLALANWRACSLPRPRRHFPLTVL